MLVPPDRNRCQAEITSYHPFVMGGQVHRTERCTNKPVLLVKEKEAGSDGLRGSMTLCQSCYAVFLKQPGLPAVDVEPVNKEEE